VKGSQDMPWDPMVDYQWMRHCTDCYFSLWRSLKPVVTKVRGFAVAGGSEWLATHETPLEQRAARARARCPLRQVAHSPRLRLFPDAGSIAAYASAASDQTLHTL
jgi:enoyl-CoA hydratase/carnithine racemase